jgi:hypothetical protein
MVSMQTIEKGTKKVQNDIAVLVVKIKQGKGTKILVKFWQKIYCS